MPQPEVIYQYLQQYADCTDDSDEAIERSNDALYSLMDLLDTAKEDDIFSPKDIPELCNIVLKMELELEDEHSSNIEWSVKDQILELIMSLICIEGVSVWGDLLAQTINQFRQVNREYMIVAVEHLLSFFLFGKTSEDDKTIIENRIAFLEALQRNILDYWQLLISYCEAYIAEWSENYDITPEEQSQLETAALQANWNMNQFCLHFYDPNSDKQNKHLLDAALRLNLHLYQFYLFLRERHDDKIDFQTVSFLSKW